jgi:hypothetical protein
MSSTPTGAAAHSCDATARLCALESQVSTLTHRLDMADDAILSMGAFIREHMEHVTPPHASLFLRMADDDVLDEHVGHGY